MCVYKSYMVKCWQLVNLVRSIFVVLIQIVSEDLTFKKIREKNFWIKNEIMDENLELLNSGS